ncbi:MAG: hypothetical protein ACRDU0_11660 [Mycobacterium sp.]
MDLSKLRTADWIIGVAGILFIINLFLPWASASFGFSGPSGGGFSVTATANGVSSPGAVWGILALIVAVIMVVQVVMARLTSAKMPELGGVTWGQVHLVGGIAVVVLAVLKLIAVRHYIGWATWVGIVLGAILTYGGVVMSRLPAEPAGGSTAMPGSQPTA